MENIFEIKAKWENSIFIRNNDINSISFDFIMRINEIIGLLDISNGYNRYTERFANIKGQLYLIYNDNKSIRIDEIFNYFIREYINPSKDIKSEYIFFDCIDYYDNNNYTINYFVRDRYCINHLLHIKVYMHRELDIFTTSIEINYLSPKTKTLNNYLFIDDSNISVKNWSDNDDRSLITLYNPDKNNLNKFYINDIFKYINSITCEDHKHTYILKDLNISFNEK